MRYLLTLLACMFFSFTYAEMINNVEYRLPEAAKNWVIANKLENKNGLTLVYIPENVDKSEAKEFFGVNSNHLSANLDDITLMKDSLEKLFPGVNIKVEVLDKGKDSLIYEVIGDKDGMETYHSWGRIFALKDGTVVISYQTWDISHIDKVRALWLPVLKEAHTQN